MENKKNWKTWLFSPFRFIAGKEALGIGIVVLLVLSLLAYLTNTYFDGILDIHYGCLDKTHPFGLHLIYVFGSWLILSLVLYLTALILNRKVRAIDLFGTIAVAKLPYIVATLVGLFPAIHLCIDLSNLSDLSAMIDQMMFPLLCSMAVLIPITIWYIVLLYNAFSISANVKGTKGIISFVIGLIISEVLAIIIIPIILKSINIL